MRKIAFTWVAICAVVFGAWQASAQLIGEGVFKAVPAVAGFQGPGDITSGAIAFYSAGRAYNAAYAAAQSPIADIVDTGTGLAACTYNVGTNGFANLSAIVCPTGAPTVNVVTFCTVTHPSGCRITKLYDQTGNGNHVLQATLANMPGLTLSAQNGLPCAAGGATVQLLTAGSVVQVAPFTRTAVAERTGSVTTRQDVTGNAANSQMGFANTANTVRVNSGSVVILTAADNAFHALLAVASPTAPLFAVDSSANTSTSSNGSATTSGALSVMNNNASTFPTLAGFVCEAGIWAADLNSSYQAMLANMRSATNGWNF